MDKIVNLGSQKEFVRIRKRPLYRGGVISPQLS